jgi:hypothetical protein
MVVILLGLVSEVLVPGGSRIGVARVASGRRTAGKKDANDRLAGADPRSPHTATNAWRRANRARGPRSAGVVTSRWTTCSWGTAGRGTCSAAVPSASGRRSARAGAARGRTAKGHAARGHAARGVGSAAGGGAARGGAGATSERCPAARGVAAASGRDPCQDQGPCQPSSERSECWRVSQREDSLLRCRLAQRGQTLQPSCRSADLMAAPWWAWFHDRGPCQVCQSTGQGRNSPAARGSPPPSAAHGSSSVRANQRAGRPSGPRDPTVPRAVGLERGVRFRVRRLTGRRWPTLFERARGLDEVFLRSNITRKS